MEQIKKRLLSLDVLRGITVAGMILVNNAGGRLSYAPLRHTAWNGLTPCDLVFPFFLFIMGVSTYISLNKFGFRPSSQVVRKIWKRTLLILCIGWAIGWLDHACEGDFFPFAHLRILGVLQRIALCYCVVSFVALYVSHKCMPALAAVLLAAYTYIIYAGNGYACDETNILAVIDRAIFGEAHLYAKSPIDPEGFVSTLSAIAHTLIGFGCGHIIVKMQPTKKKVLWLFLLGVLLTNVGLLLVDVLPLNKRIWSPTFVLVTCGLASVLLAVLMFLIDIKDKQRWCRFFVIFGVNPLFLYVLSEVLGIVMGNFGLKSAAYAGILAVIPDEYLASLVYALCFMLALGGVGWPLYRKRIYIKL